MCSDDVDFEPLSVIVDRLLAGLVGEAADGPYGSRRRAVEGSAPAPHSGALFAAPRHIAAPRDAAILEFVKVSRIGAADLWDIGGDKERAAKTPTSGRAPATPGDQVAVAS